MMGWLRRLFGGEGAPAGARRAEDPLGDVTLVRRQAPLNVSADSDERFRLLVASVSDYAIFLLDPAGHIVSWNAGAERLKGYAANEILGQHFSRFYPREDIESEKPRRELEIATATGKYEEEGWRLRKDGSRFWANVVITALRDADGTLVGFAKVTRDLTARREAEATARQLAAEEAAHREEARQREQLRVTLASIGDAVIVTDVEGRITFMNAVAQHVTRWTLEEAAGRPCSEIFRIVNEETRAPVESPVDRVLREGIIVGLANHTVLIARDGRDVPIDDSGAPIRDESGKLSGVVLIFRDVTEARRSIETRMHLAAIVESSDDAIISRDLEGRVMSWNRAAERLYGYSAEEMLGRSMEIVMPSDHPEELPGLSERMLRGERIEHFETVRIRKDGRRVDVSLTMSPVRDGYGRIVGSSKIARDISERKRNDASLRLLARASAALSTVHDPESALRHVARLAVPEFADACVIDLSTPEGPRRVAEAGVASSSRLMPRDVALPAGSHGGACITPEKDLPRGLTAMVTAPLRTRGEVIGIMRLAMEGSGRAFSEQDVRIADDLASRTAIALQNARLYEELRDADRRKDEFLAMLAHELRNPLAPIRNALHVLGLVDPSPSGAEPRAIIERQLAHLVRLVDDLLDVSRIMRGHIDLRREPVQVASIVAMASETAQPVLEARGQQLVTSLPEQPLWLFADPARLAQVVSNLLHNAAKFSDRAGRIWLSVEREGADAIIRVRDEGEGIPPELLPRIFDLFVQGDQSLERSHGGLGLGLTIVQRMVAMHGGTVVAHSPGRGRGTEMIVRLPAIPAPLVGAPKDGARSFDHAHRRVLVVDDNVDAAESAAMMLRAWGHDVTIANDGPEALARAAERPPELVLLDIGLPGMNGYEVARALRERGGATPRLVAISGYGQEDDRVRSAEAGFERHVTKPIEPGLLRQIVES